MRVLKSLFLIAFIVIILTDITLAQGVSINNTGIKPDTSAILDVSSTNQGVLFPRIDSSDIGNIVLPAKGLQIFNDDCGNFMYNAGTPGAPNWVALNQSPNVPAMPGSISGSTTVSPGETGLIYTIAAVSGATSYTWYVPFGTITSGQGTNSIEVSTTCSAKTGIITVTANNGCGSSSYSMLPVTIDGALAVSTPDTVYGNSQLGGSPTASGGTAPYTYQWSPSSDISGDDVANPWAYCTGSTTTYKITITDDIGCTAVDSTVVLRNIVANAGTDNSVVYACNSNNSTAIGGSPTGSGGYGSLNYSWSPATYLSDAYSANPSAGPDYTTTYTVTVSDSKGCTATDDVVITVTGSTVVTFNPTGSGRNGSYQNWTVPGGVSCIKVETTGAKGGNGMGGGNAGGKGAVMSGSFNVTPGQQFLMVVGQQGGTGSRGGSGGGGSFFTLGTDMATSTIWITAGGGGGSSCNYGTQNATSSTTAQNGSAGGGAGGTAGNGGGAGSQGTGGSGFLTNGGGGYAGLAFRNGSTGGVGGGQGADGGFGGGSGSHEGGGGGGGYSGGGGGGCCCDGAGGGGGSYNSGNNQYNYSAINNGDGKIVIMY